MRREWGQEESARGALWISADLPCGTVTPALWSRRQALGPGSLGFSLALSITSSGTLSEFIIALSLRDSRIL